MAPKSNRAKIGIVLLIGAAEVLFGPGYLYARATLGKPLYSLRSASEHLLPLFTQNLISSAFSGVLLLLALFSLKRNFSSAMSLKLKGKIQKTSAVGLVAALVGMTIAGIAIQKDPVTVLYNLFYYFALVAFAEEFVFRGVSAYLLRGCSRNVRFLLPNILFAVAHLFAYNNFGALTVEQILSFAISNVLGLTVMGCIFQVLKEKTGTLWIPVLIHTICDFVGIFTH